MEGILEDSAEPSSFFLCLWWWHEVNLRTFPHPKLSFWAYYRTFLSLLSTSLMTGAESRQVMHTGLPLHGLYSGVVLRLLHCPFHITAPQSKRLHAFPNLVWGFGEVLLRDPTPLPLNSSTGIFIQMWKNNRIVLSLIFSYPYHTFQKVLCFFSVDGCLLFSNNGTDFSYFIFVLEAQYTKSCAVACHCL